MHLFDTHTHLNADDLYYDTETYIERAIESSVSYMAVVGFDRKTISRSLELSEKYPNLISVVGCHPTEAKNYDAKFEKDLLGWLDRDKTYMLGEIGLDYYWDESPKDIQAKVFRRQIAIAKEHHLPITIHNREASLDCYKILKEEGIPEAGGIMHSFGGNSEMVKKFLDLGMHISFSGVLTFKKSNEVREAAKLVPRDKLLIETDAPYLAPVPKRGKKNEPAYVKYVAETLAEIKELPVEEIAELTTQNAMNLFKWFPKGVN